jgi:hypothetical protein
LIGRIKNIPIGGMEEEKIESGAVDPPIKPKLFLRRTKSLDFPRLVQVIPDTIRLSKEIQRKLKPQESVTFSLKGKDIFNTSLLLLLMLLIKIAFMLVDSREAFDHYSKDLESVFLNEINICRGLAWMDPKQNITCPFPIISDLALLT